MNSSLQQIRRIVPVLVLIAALFITTSVLALGVIERVSVASDGTQTSGGSSIESSISAKGRYVAFTSSSSNLVSGDTNGTYDIFVHDRNTGATSRVSIASDGTGANDRSYQPAISADGRYVAFQSGANNLVAGDTNSTSDIFVHDRNTGATSRVSIASDGTQANDISYLPAISADGRYVVFYCAANNLVVGDTNGQRDVFVHDRSTGVTSRVSVASDGTQANGYSHSPSISADGRYVAFHSVSSSLVTGDMNNDTDIFVHDRSTRVTSRVSVDSSGTEVIGDSLHPSISADGRYVAFHSVSSSLVANDTNGQRDIFVHDRSTGITSRVSVDSSGIQASGGDSSEASISADGRYVVFQSEASNLITGDTNGVEDIFVHDRNTGATSRVSVDSNGIQASQSSGAPVISGNGVYVAFDSRASNLITDDTNSVRDVFVSDNDLIEADMLPATGFARDKMTDLPVQPAEKVYAGTDMFLDIPSLNVKMPIVGVPLAAGSWDVTWLGENAGYLAGSAFPTWAGNTVLTGHVWNAYNEPGPFAELKALRYGDTFAIHAWGQTYTYEVRETKLVMKRNVDAVLAPEDYDWVTLLTCEFYNPLTGEYISRRMVRAVLVSVE